MYEGFGQWVLYAHQVFFHDFDFYDIGATMGRADIRSQEKLCYPLGGVMDRFYDLCALCACQPPRRCR